MHVSFYLHMVKPKTPRSRNCARISCRHDSNAGTCAACKIIGAIEDMGGKCFKVQFPRVHFVSYSLTFIPRG